MAGASVATLLKAPVPESRGGNTADPSFLIGIMLFRYGPIGARVSKPYSWANTAGPAKANATNIPGSKRIGRRRYNIIVGRIRKIREIREPENSRQNYTGRVYFSSTNRNQSGGAGIPLYFARCASISMSTETSSAIPETVSALLLKTKPNWLRRIGAVVTRQ